MSVIKSIVTIPVYLVATWLIGAGLWQTFEIYRWADSRVEQVEQAANVLNIFGE